MFGPGLGLGLTNVATLSKGGVYAAIRLNGQPVTFTHQVITLIEVD